MIPQAALLVVNERLSKMVAIKVGLILHFFLLLFQHQLELVFGHLEQAKDLTDIEELNELKDLKSASQLLIYRYNDTYKAEVDTKDVNFYYFDR